MAIERLHGGAGWLIDALVARDEQIELLQEIAEITPRFCNLVARDEQIELLQEIAEITPRSRRDLGRTPGVSWAYLRCISAINLKQAQLASISSHRDGGSTSAIFSGRPVSERMTKRLRGEEEAAEDDGDDDG